jgi:LysM repeat protein
MRRMAALAAGVAAIGAGAAGLAPAAGAAVPHTVLPGETLWGIAAANGLTTRTVAVFNGLPEDYRVIAGETIEVPTVEEGTAALEAAGIEPGSATSEASAAASHTVEPGETVWGIATANGLSVDAVAAWNGLSDPNLIVVGSTLEIPSADEAAAAGYTASSTIAVPTDGAPAATPEETAWLTTIPSPFGDVFLDPAAAESWNAMREESLATFGIDLYPGGPLSGFRTYAQQDYLYQLYLSGQGELAAAPGTSEHELGIAVDLADPVMRDIVDQIGPQYGWYPTVESEWWHVAYLGG